MFLSSRTRPLDFIRQVSEQLPEGVSVREVCEVGMALPSLQSEVRWAEYQVDLDAGVSAQDARSAVETFLAAESMPWEHTRDKEVRRYDIRPLVQDIWLEESPPDAKGLRLGMRLRADSSGSAIQISSTPLSESIDIRGGAADGSFDWLRCAWHANTDDRDIGDTRRDRRKPDT